MRNQLLFIATVLLLSLNTTAQKIKTGVKAGANVAMLTGDEGIMTSIYGVHAGGFVEFRVLGKVAIQPEILFSTQGAKHEFNSSPIFGTEIKNTSNIHLNYVNVPLMFKYFVNRGLFIEVGPQASVLISAIEKRQTTTTSTLLTIEESTKTDVKKLFNEADWSANVGIGYDFLNKVFIQARYSMGLTNVYNDKNLYDISDVNVKNGVFQLSMGLKF